MSYERVPSEELLLRDVLARDRTVLANERTLLAYWRTGLMLVISGATLLKLSDHPTTATYASAGASAVLGAAIAVWGSIRCAKLQNELRRISP